MSDTPQWTEEELAALPQTRTVFDQPSLVFDDHEWLQEGYMVRDVCSPSQPTCMSVGIPIPSGKLLIKRKGRYDLVDELRGA